MDKFDLHEWIGKGEKNLLREGRDEDDFTTTVAPEELGMHPDDHTLEEMSDDDDDIYDPNKDPINKALGLVINIIQKMVPHRHLVRFFRELFKQLFGGKYPEDSDLFREGEDPLEEGQLNEDVIDDLIKAIFGSAAKKAVKKKSEEEVKSLHKKIFGFDYKDRNKKGPAKDL